MENRPGKAMIAPVLLAVTIPVALGGLASRTLARHPVNANDPMQPYRELLSSVDHTIREIEREVSAQRETIDWSPLIPPRPAPSKALDDPAEEQAAIAPLFNLYLGGIVWKKDQPRAYVNERVVAEGETIEGFRVVAIEPNRVTFEGPDGQTYICDIDVQLRNEYPGFYQP